MRLTRPILQVAIFFAQALYMPAVFAKENKAVEAHRKVGEPGNRHSATELDIIEKPSYGSENPHFPYPMAAWAYGQEGRVIVRVQIMPDGTTGQTWIKQSSGSAILDIDAREQLAKYRFKPAHKNGQPVTAWIDVPVDYRLHSQNPNAPKALQAFTPTPNNPETLNANRQFSYLPSTVADIRSPRIILIGEIASQIQTNQSHVQLHGHIEDASPIGELTLDGAAVALDTQGRFSHTIYVPTGETTLRLRAVDRHGNVGEKTVRVIRSTTAVAQSANTPLIPPSSQKSANPKSLALIIGAEKYALAPDAQNAEKDAVVFYDYANLALGVPANRIRLLKGGEATRGGILRALKTWLPSMVEAERSDVFIFFAGHGLARPDGKDAYLLPQDGDPGLLADTALSRGEFVELIGRTKPRQAVMFMDTCYSGVARGGKQALMGDARPIRLVADQTQLPANFTMFSAAANDQISGSLPDQPHGAFSYFVMRGLGGEADANKDRKITVGELHAYVAERVRRASQQMGREQVPQLAGNPETVLVGR